MSLFRLNWQQIQDFFAEKEIEIKGSSTLDSVTTANVLPIKVDGAYFPMHSDYVFDLKKVYTEEPKRTNSGAISVFPSKIFVPYFTVTYNLVHLDIYYEMMSRLQSDENVVLYYDSFAKKYKTAKFYAQQPTISKTVELEGEYKYIQELKIVFAGTLNDTSVVNIEYSANGGSNAPASISGNVGEEFKVDAGTALTRTGYEFVGWNTASDGSGVAYVPSSIRSFATNLTLYAQWQVAEYSRLSLSYGVGKPATDSDGNNITSIQVKYNTPISGLPESVIVWNNTTNAEFVDNNGNPVYTFAGWYTLTNGEGSKINNGSTYLVQGDSSVYAHYNVRSYTITFNSNGGTNFDAISGEYGMKISLPKPYKDGKTFVGWYIDSSLTSSSQFSKTTIPAENITLYAKYK